MPIKAAFFIAFVCGFSTTVYAVENLDQLLTDQYHDAVLALRHSFKAGTQHYASDGTPMQTGEEGSWTIYGRIAVTKIGVEAKQLRVEGKRVLYFFGSGGNLVRFQDDRKHPAQDVKVIVHLQRPLTSLDEAREALSSVFALTPEDMVNSVPDYWREHLAKQLGVEVPKNTGHEHESKSIDPGNAGDQRKAAKSFEPVDATRYTAPHVLYSPEPAYTDVARKRGIQGVVGLNIIVDSAGQVRNPKIVHPLGMGLDENAMDTVRTWRFEPAKRDGQPITVAMHVEVDFHLF